MELPNGWTSDTVNVNDTTLQYYRVRSGSPIVMAHGFYESGLCWEPLVSDLKGDYDVIAYDARGHGGSAAPETGYEMEDRVEDLVGLVNELELTDPILLGHSMGGSTIAWAAATYPDLPRAIVLEEPAGLLGASNLEPEERVQIVQEKVDEWEQQSIDELAAEHDEYPDLYARRLAQAKKQCDPLIAEIARIGYPSPTEAFPKIRCPTLVLQSDADPERRATELDVADELAQGRLVHVPEAGHSVFADQYDAAYAELRTFLLRL